MKSFLIFLSLFLLPTVGFANGETSSPNMNMPIPAVGVTTGPQYANDINSSLLILDKHNHSPGQGVPITPSGLNISSDLLFNANNATLLRSARFSPQLIPISGPADLGAIYESGVDLYYNDGSGNQVRITQSGGVAGSPGSIANLNSPASASFVAANATFVWQSGASVAGNMDFATAILRYPGSYPTPAGNYIALQAPSALATGFALTLPATLPATLGAWMTSDTSGNLSWTNVDNSTLQYSSNVVSVKNGGITRVQEAALGQQVSSGSGTFTTTSTTWVDVTNLSVTITTTGKPVMLMLQSNSSASPSYIACTAGTPGTLVAQFSFARAGSTISQYQVETSASSGQNSTVPSSAMQFMDTGVVGSPGTYTYKVQAQVFGSSNAVVSNTVLVAYEL